MPAILTTGAAAETKRDLLAIIQSMPRSRVVDSDDQYVHVEFRTLVFGFIDDVEFLIDEKNSVIHYRASARVGYSDLGVNRRRLTEIRERFENRPSNDPG